MYYRSLTSSHHALSNTAVADAPVSGHRVASPFDDADPPPLDAEALLAEVGLPAHSIRALLSHTVAGGFGG